MSLTLWHRVLVVPIRMLLLATASRAHRGGNAAGAIEVLAPTGPYAVGRMTLRWMDEAREESITPEPADHRRLVVHIVIAALRPGSATSERRLAATVRQLTLAVVEATLGDGSIERLSQIQREQPGIAIERWNGHEMK
jgi:hypothetical protein